MKERSLLAVFARAWVEGLNEVDRKTSQKFGPLGRKNGSVSTFSRKKINRKSILATKEKVSRTPQDFVASCFVASEPYQSTILFSVPECSLDLKYFTVTKIICFCFFFYTTLRSREIRPSLYREYSVTRWREGQTGQ